jgi:hypothetical protein
VSRRPGPLGTDGGRPDDGLARLQRLRRALRDSEPTARHLLLARFEGLELASICTALIDAAQDVALIYIAASARVGSGRDDPERLVPASRSLPAAGAPALQGGPARLVARLSPATQPTRVPRASCQTL